MNYLREINAFYDWLETNPLSTSAIVLWHAYMHINNKTGWAAEFAVAVSVLCVKTGLSARAIYDARNELKIKGRLQWKSRNGNQSAVYGLQPLCATGADNTTDKHVDNTTDKHVDKSTLLNKRNENEKKGKSPPTPLSQKSLALFEKFWEVYPKKRAKGQAEKVWSRINPNEQLMHLMLSVIERAKTSVDWTKNGGQYIPYPATWLNAKGWEDEYTQAEQNHSRADPIQRLPRAYESLRQFAEEGD